VEGRTVLFVDGSEDSRAYIDALSDRRLRVVHAARPEDALHSLARELPDVVVTNVVFADTAIGAAEFIRDLRTRVDAATSILVLTQYGRLADRESAAAAGADLFLTRSAPPAALVFEVHRALILRRSGRRLAWNWRRCDAVVPSPVVDRRHALSVSVRP
jgi:DNA-binding NarL/FixJ family response regulator